MEPGHLLQVALTHPSSANSRRLKSRHPFAPTAQHLISLSDNNVRVAQWVDYQWNVEWTDSPTRLRISIPDTGTHPSEWPSQEEPGSSLTASATVSDVSAPAYTNGVWPPLRPVSMVQKNKLSTMLPSNVQSIELPMDYSAWPDGSGRCDNWMAAQHLPQDLLWPSSGFNNSLKRRSIFAPLSLSPSLSALCKHVKMIKHILAELPLSKF